MPRIEKERRAIEELKDAASQGVGVERTELADDDLDEVSGGCLCQCGSAATCGGAGGGPSIS